MSTLSHILHPYHVSLLPHTSFSEAIHQPFHHRSDPYYEYDGMEARRGVGRPKFNVIEMEDRYLLDGELPGVEKKNQLTIEWLQNQVLIIKGVVNPVNWKGLEKDKDKDKDGASEVAPDGAEENGSEAKTEEKSAKSTYPHRLLTERKFGDFQRSFTFPAAIDADAMTATLEDGVLKLEIPKKKGEQAMEKKTIPVSWNCRNGPTPCGSPSFVEPCIMQEEYTVLAVQCSLPEGWPNGENCFVFKLLLYFYICIDNLEQEVIM